MKRKNKESSIWMKASPFEIGIIGAIALLSAYIVILSALNSFSHAMSQFLSMRYWVLALAAGFGVQIGLYAHIKQAAYANARASAEIAATGGASATSMLGCCLHHVTDVVPIIGLSAATFFVSQYTEQFMILGVASSIVGITMMLNIIQKHKLYAKKSSFSALSGFDMAIVRNITIIVSVLAITTSFYFAYTAISGAGTTSAALELPEKTNDANAVSISAQPINFSFGSQIAFNVALNTHQGSLDYDIEKISVLKDAEGNTYQPISWNGSPPGGHHRSGILAFPALKGKTSSMTLIIKGVYDVPERVFEWNIN